MNHLMSKPWAALLGRRLVQVLEDYALPQADIYAVFPERHHLSAKVRVFVDFLMAYFRKGAEDRW